MDNKNLELSGMELGLESFDRYFPPLSGCFLKGNAINCHNSARFCCAITTKPTRYLPQSLHAFSLLISSKIYWKTL
jgi:hypothetical protein